MWAAVSSSSPLLFLPNAQDRPLNGRDVSRSECWALVYGGLFSLFVKTFQARVKADERLGMSEN